MSKYFVWQHGKRVEITEKRFDEICASNPDAKVWCEKNNWFVKN